MKKIIFLSFYLLFTSGIFAQGQDTVRVQVSFDSKGLVKEVDASLEEQLHLFPEIIGFEHAKVFKTSDSTYSVEIVSNGKLLLRKLRNQGFIRLRDKIDKGLADMYNAKEELDNSPIAASQEENGKEDSTKTVIRKPGINQEGRTSLLIGTTIASTFFYSPQIAGLFDFEGSRFAGMVLLGGAAGFLVPYFATENKIVTSGMSGLAISGAALGYWHGVYFAGLVSINAGRVPEKAFIAYPLLFSVGEGIAGYLYAKANRIDKAQASVIGYGSTYGTAAGTFFGIALADENSFKNTTRVFFISGIAGGFAGAYLGDYLARREFYTDGDGVVASITTPAAIYVANSLYSSFGLFDEPFTIAKVRSIGLTEAVTIGGAYLLGDVLVRNRNFTRQDGIYLSLATLAGGLAGAGIGLIADPDNGKTVFLSSGIGTALGYVLAYSGYEKKRRVVKFPTRGSLDFQINPAAFSSVLNSKTNSMLTPSWGSLTYTF